MANSRPLTDMEETVFGGKDSRYPDQFFDLASTYIPSEIKKLFKFCRNFYYTNGFLRNVINKLTEYPITSLLYEDVVDEEVKDKYDKVFNEKLKIKKTLIEIGTDLNVYGNCFVSAFLKPKRMLKFSDGSLYSMREVKFRMRNYEIHAIHPDTGLEEKVKIEDKYIKSVDNFKLVRWSPLNIDIDSKLMDADYFYKIPNKIKKRIITGDVEILEEIPLVFLESLKKNKAIKLKKETLYHFKAPTLAEDDNGWGYPIILPALKDIFYLQTLKKGNEAIALEHITPKKMMSPSSGTGVDPFAQLGLGRWKTEMEKNVKQWRKDPNHIAISSIPVAYQEMGGNARGLMVNQEMRLIEENIINSLGVPLEFIKGGVSWQGSSISLRIVENHFLAYREMLEDFLNNFVVRHINKFLGIGKVQVKFKKFKMSDDGAAKQLMLNLSQANKISDKKLLDEFGYDYDREIENTQEEIKRTLDMNIERKKREAEAQGEAQVILAKYNAEAQYRAQIAQIKIRAELFQDEIEKEFGGLPSEPMKLIEQYAMKVFNLPQAQQQQFLNTLEQKKPVTHSLLMERIAQLTQNQEAQNQYNQAFSGGGSSTNSNRQEKKDTKKAANPKAEGSDGNAKSIK